MVMAEHHQDDLRIIEDSVAKWLDGLPLSALQMGQPQCNATLWQGMRSLGLCGLAVAESHGGAGLGLPGIALVMRECGKRRLVSPLLSTSLLAVDVLTACGGDRALLRLAGIADGQRCMAVAASGLMEPGGCAVAAERRGAAWRLSGTLSFVADMGVADSLLLLLETDSGARIFELATAQLRIQPLSMVDGSDFAHVGVDVELGDDACLGEIASAQQLAWVLDRARLALACEMLGLAQRSLQMTVEYLQTREQFGQKIGAFQALQHRMAKVYIKIALAEASVEAALLADSTAFLQAATVAVEMVAQASRLVSNECLQMHGGIGMTDEHLAGHYLKRARLLERRLMSGGSPALRYASLQGF